MRMFNGCILLYINVYSRYQKLTTIFSMIASLIYEDIYSLLLQRFVNEATELIEEELNKCHPKNSFE